MFRAHLRTFEEGRSLDDYGHAVVRFENGALGTVTASQVSHGRENDLFIEVDGTKGAIQWRQENPNELIVRRNGQAHQIYAGTAGPYLGGCRPLRAVFPAAIRKRF